MQKYYNNEENSEESNNLLFEENYIKKASEKINELIMSKVKNKNKLNNLKKFR